jgi:HlyD family secretion protein
MDDHGAPPSHVRAHRAGSFLSRLALTLIVATTAFNGLPAASRAANEAAAAGPPAIRVVAAEKRELVDRLSVNGTIVARQEAAVGADLNGLRVVALKVEAGDMVRKGDVLAVLDRSALDTQLAEIEATRFQAEANIAQMRAEISVAEIEVRQAEAVLARVRALERKGVSTEAQLDNAVNAADSANARLVSAQRALAASATQLGVIDAQRQNVILEISRTQLRAPADGLVLARDATLGGVVSSSGAPLFRIAIGSEFELAADVAETSLPRLAPGMPAEVSLAGVKGNIGGSIRRISPEIDRASRLGSIRISLEAGSGARAGSFARGVIELSRREGIAVPSSALIYKGSEAFLQRVAAGKVRTVAVTLGARADGFVEVVSGLAAGSEVVLRAGSFVADGDMVTPVRREPAEAIGR